MLFKCYLKITQHRVWLWKHRGLEWSWEERRAKKNTLSSGLLIWVLDLTARHWIKKISHMGAFSLPKKIPQLRPILVTFSKMWPILVSFFEFVSDFGLAPETFFGHGFGQKIQRCQCHKNLWNETIEFHRICFWNLSKIMFYKKN